MKTMCMWVRSGCRKPKFEQLASTPGAAGYIINTAQAAKAKRGKLYIVDAKTADHARTIINIYTISKQERRKPVSLHALPVVLSLCDDRIVAIGATALHAIHGASRAARLWDQRIAKYGAVPDAMDNPLHHDNLNPPSMADSFGEGLFL
ncbi:MAG: hypothetical protein CMI60_18140 [Parvibaculum sp.]|nr:hypothetical protein [Parvibaculum sp.]|tara:strand:- start:150 stop:596 length:447 start_codon:yes stop_codon:yes gene_type:complete